MAPPEDDTRTREYRVSVRELARAYHVTERTVFNWIARGTVEVDRTRRPMLLVVRDTEPPTP